MTNNPGVMTAPTAPDPTWLMITCWCERAFGFQPPEKINRGETFSCGHPDCTSEAAKKLEEAT